jgi:putative transcriptional regulator
MAEDRSDLGLALEEGLREALAWKRGEVALEVVNVEPMPPKRIKAIRRKAARSARAFETRFGISASTLQNWEQGRRRPDPTARLLLKVIEADADFVERVARLP